MMDFNKNCIWLLENLYKIHPGVAQSKVNFLKKETYITFRKSDTTLREIVRLLASIGYAPEINLKDIDTGQLIIQVLVPNTRQLCQQCVY